MKSLQLDKLALLHGISLTRPTPDGRDVPISNETKRKVLSALRIGSVLKDAPRTHGELSMRHSKTGPKRKMAKCYLPKFLKGSRAWGISLQLYELRSSRNWGIGDFEDLSAMADLAGSLGADFLGVNPLHAPLLADPDRCSPYEPSNRQHLNPLYIAVDLSSNKHWKRCVRRI
jgi:4-alpha-glucanotransferase